MAFSSEKFSIHLHSTRLFKTYNLLTFIKAEQCKEYVLEMISYLAEGQKVEIAHSEQFGRFATQTARP